LTNEKQGPAVRSYILHSSLAGAQLGGAFYKPQKTEQNMLKKNHFLEPHLAFLDFSSSNFYMQGHILSTGGDALIMLQFQKNPNLHKKEIK